MLVEFSLFTPVSISELIELFKTNNDACILAGGTDLLVDIRNGLKKPQVVIDIKKIEELNELKIDDKNGLSIGASVTYNQLIENKEVNLHYPLVVESAKTVASYQLRNRATIVGNICTASPASDMSPALLCLQANVVIVGANGERVVPLRDFFKSVKQTILEKGEIVKKVVVPATSKDAIGGYMKAKRIKGHDLSILGVAMAKYNDKIYISIGSAATTPFLVGEFLVSESLENIIAKAKSMAKPIDDIRASAEYRLHLIEVYIKRLYNRLVKNV